jgi:hypothetical protein
MIRPRRAASDDSFQALDVLAERMPAVNVGWPASARVPD